MEGLTEEQKLFDKIQKPLSEVIREVQEFKGKYLEYHPAKIVFEYNDEMYELKLTKKKKRNV